MSKGLFFKDLVKGIIASEAIDEKGELDFLVTFKTWASEEGHIIWLKNEFEPWFKEIKKIPGVLNAGGLKVEKASGKSKMGSIELGIKIAGGFRMTPDANTMVAGIIVSAIRKSAAKTIHSYYGPKFNYQKPLFYAIHNHYYEATPCCSDWDKGNRRLKRLQSNNWKLKHLIDDCGAMLKDFVILDKNKVIRIILRWKQNASDESRGTLEKVIKAYFRGMDFELMSWKCLPLKD